MIGYFVVKGELATATSLLFVAGVSDLVDGYLARKYSMGTVLGSILDPAADKLLMTTMVVSLTVKGLLPRQSRVSSLSLSLFSLRFTLSLSLCCRGPQYLSPYSFSVGTCS